MKLSLSCRALLWSAPGRDFLSDRGVVDATTLARLVGKGRGEKRKERKKKKEEREYNTLGNSAFFSVWLNWVLRYDSFHGLGGYLDKSAGLSLLCERRLW